LLKFDAIGKTNAMNKLKMHSPNLTQDNIARIRELFPGCITEAMGENGQKIDTSNMADVYYKPDALDKGNLELFVDNIKPDRAPEDLLFQVMLDWGVDLALPITRQTIQGKEVYFVATNSLVACFDKTGTIDEVFVKELAKYQPVRAVFRDAGYADDDVKINVEQIFKLLSPVTEVKSI
jgi:adenine-specific DNA-methyltransferase